MKILILEDNLKALNVIMEVLGEISLANLAVTVFSEAEKVKDFLKNNSDFDLVLLDYYGVDGNFHQPVFSSQILPEKIIAISSIEERNVDARKKGALCSVQKNLSDLSKFKEELKREISIIIKK
jgi:response regulator of citrate/malate metabolism